MWNTMVVVKPRGSDKHKPTFPFIQVSSTTIRDDTQNRGSQHDRRWRDMLGEQRRLEHWHHHDQELPQLQNRECD